MASSNSYREAVNLRLKKTIYKGNCNYQIKIKADYDGCSGNLLIYGSASKPCKLPSSTKFSLDSVTISDCGLKQYLLGRINVNHSHNSAQWPTYTINIADSTIPDSGINYISIVGFNIDSPQITPAYIIIDDVELTGGCDSNKLIVTANQTSIAPCAGTNFTITYNIALASGQGNKNTKSLVFKPLIPDDITIFNSNPPLDTNGYFIIAKDSLTFNQPKTISITFSSSLQKVRYDKTYSIAFDIINSDACVATTSSNITFVYFQKQPVYVKYSVNKDMPGIGEQVKHTVIVCNTANTAQSNIILTDTIPNEFIIDSAIGFTISGNIISKSFSLSASSTSFGYCDTFYLYTSVINSCSNIGKNITNFIYSNIQNASCPRPLPEYIKFKIPFTVKIQKPNPPICNSTGRIIADVSPAGDYTFLWFKDGLPLQGDTIDILEISSYGNYYVQTIDKNGCSSFSDTLTIGQPISIIVNQNYSCNLNQSSVSVVASGGLAPYKYLWIDGDTNNLKSNLSNNFYSITVSDALGCSKNDSFYIGYKEVGSAASPPCSSISEAISTGKLINSFYFQGPGILPQGYNQKLRIKGTFYINQTLPYYFMPGTEIIMAPGSKIIVNSGKNITFYGCTIRGCDSMWNGIEVENNASITIANSTIEDALYALRIKRNANMGIYKSKFKNNYIGIYTDSNTTSTASYVNMYIPMTDDTFLLSGNLKPNYTGMSPLSGLHNLSPPLKPLAGIHVQDLSYFEMGSKDETTYEYMPWDMDIISTNNPTPKTPDPNLFYGLENGIIAFNTSLTIMNSKFEEIMNSGYTPNLSSWSEDGAIRGYGIYGFTDLKNNPFGKMLKVQGLGKEGTDYTFLSCSRAIFTKGYSCEVTNTNTIGCATAMDIAFPPTSGNVYIYENTITANHMGIRLLNGGKNSFQIGQNEINISNLQSNTVALNPNFVATGIRIMEPSDPITFCTATGSKCDYVEGNTINLIGTVFYGIFTSNTKRVGINNNIINLSNPLNTSMNGLSEILGGISVNAGSRNSIVENTVNGVNRFQSTSLGAQPGLFPVGIFDFITEGYLQCNYTNNIRTGVRFTGACNGSNINRTNFYNSSTGLLVDTMATIPPQPNRGNRWFGQFTTAARNGNSITNVFKQQFTVSNLSPDEMKPYAPYTTYTVIPSFGWFVINFPNLPDDSVCASSGSGGIIPPATNPILSEIDSLILTDSFYFNEFVTEQRLENKEMLYERFKAAMSNYTNNSLVTTFMNNSDTSGIADFYALERAILDSLQASIFMETQFQSLMNSKNSLISYINTLDSLLLTDTSEVLQNYYNAQLIQTRSDLTAIDQAIDSLETTFKTYRNLRANNIINNNDNANTPAIFFEYQRAYNDIYLNTIAVGNTEFSITQINDLTALANSCPLINGEAVFGARNLLSSIKGEKFYNDKVICSSQGYTYKTKQEKEAIPGVLDDLLISIFPNPVKELLSINLSKMIKGDINIEIRDLFGRIILSAKRNELLKTEVDLKIIPDGFYMVSLKNNELTIYNEKIYVQK